MDEIRLVGDLLSNPTVAGFTALFLVLTAAVIFWLIRSNSKLSEANIKLSDALIKSADSESEAVRNRDKQIGNLISTIVEGQKELGSAIRENTTATREFISLLQDNRSQIDQHDKDSIGRNDVLKTAVNQVGVHVADVGKQLRRNTDEIIATIRQDVIQNSAKIEQILKQMTSKIEGLSTTAQLSDLRNEIQQLRETIQDIQIDVSRVETLVKPPTQKTTQVIEGVARESGKVIDS